AWLAGAVPHRQSAGSDAKKKGKNSAEMLSADLKMFVLLDVEPEFDCANPQQAMSAMNQAECVVAITPYASESLKSYADILLPISTIAETSGTFVNAEGRWQSFTGASQLPCDARPAWKVLRVLGNVLDVEGFDYVSSEEVRDELQNDVNNAKDKEVELMPLYQKQSTDSGLQRISEVAMYCTDSLVRRATALHKSVENEASIALNAVDAEVLALVDAASITITQGEATAKTKLVIDNNIPQGCVFIPEGTEVSARLGASFGMVEVSA
ncbi:MAG: molybdopterin-dependent oxidoreductase, partial [Cocleimonas sp.]|nr:molybdopterin-dependent oxidoreductase [Cocleimonas sp.]